MRLYSSCLFVRPQFHMQKYVTKIVDMMKSERLFASQGGPIIITQVMTTSEEADLANIWVQYESFECDDADRE